MTKPWEVIVDPKDPEVYAVQGVYLVAHNLPIEDARLIAAAPDLLKAVERMLGPVGYANNNSITAQAKAALAKARGEQG